MSAESCPPEPSGSTSTGGSEMIVPDSHLHWELADRIMQRESWDRVWLLGDYFDDYNDTIEQVEQTSQGHGQGRHVTRCSKDAKYLLCKRVELVGRSYGH